MLLKVISWREDPCVTCLPHHTAWARAPSQLRCTRIVSNKGRTACAFFFPSVPLLPSSFHTAISVSSSPFNTHKITEQLSPKRLSPMDSYTLRYVPSPHRRRKNFPQCPAAWLGREGNCLDSHSSFPTDNLGDLGLLCLVFSSGRWSASFLSFLKAFLILGAEVHGWHVQMAGLRSGVSLVWW